MNFLVSKERFQASHIDCKTQPFAHFWIEYLRPFTLCQILMPLISLAFLIAWCSNSATPVADSKDTSLGETKKRRRSRLFFIQQTKSQMRSSVFYNISEVKRRNRCKRRVSTGTENVLRFKLGQASIKDPLFSMKSAWPRKPVSWNCSSEWIPSPPFSFRQSYGHGINRKRERKKEKEIRQRQSDGQDEKKRFALHICWVAMPQCQANRMPLPFQDSVPSILQVVAWSWHTSLWSGWMLKFGVIKIRWLDQVVFSRDGQSIDIHKINLDHFCVSSFLGAGSCGDFIFGVASVTSSASRWQRFGCRYFQSHRG